MKVIAFSLFGGNAKYVEGAIQNAIIAPHLYPDWQMRVYHDNTVPPAIIRQLQELGAVTIDKTGHFASPIFWRFLTNDDPEVDVWLSRDCDSRISYRERMAVDEWLTTERKFHVIRDHPNHFCEFPILAGMFGCRKGIIPNMEMLIREFGKFNHFTDDQYFLQHKVWPLVKDDAYQHAEFDFIGYQLPTAYENFRYIGEPFEAGPVSTANPQYRQQLIDALHNNSRTFQHIISVYSTKNAEESRRNAIARTTWVQLSGTHPQWRYNEMPDCRFTRSSRNIGDTKFVPFLKDVIECGVTLSRSDNDVIVFTNADNCLAQNTFDVVSETLERYPACVSQRYNYERLDHTWKPTANTDGGVFLPGFDLFAFTVSWWKEHKSKVADMLIGYEAWDCMLECVVRWNGGIILPEPVVYHEYHEQHWHINRLTSPGQRYNLETFASWALRMGKYEEVKNTHSYSFEAIQSMNQYHALQWTD